MANTEALLERPLARRVRSGAAWSAGSVIVLRFANIAVMVVAARLVAPDKFGVFALAVTVQAMVATVAELGVAQAITRSDLDPDRIAPTVATISLTTSLLLGASMAATAMPLADMLGDPDAAGPIRVLAVNVALLGAFAVPGAQLQREFRQRRIFFANAVAYVPSSAALIVLAVVGDGAMAFAWSSVVRGLTTGVVLLLSVSRRYWPGFNREELPALLRFGLPLALANLLSQLLMNVDYVFIGRVRGAEQVWLYVLAFNIASWPIAVLGSTMNGVVVPAFSKVDRSLDTMTNALRRATSSVALVACPIAAMTMALSRPLVLTLYGDEWGRAAPVLTVLALYGVLSVCSLLFANVVIAMGRTMVLLVVQVAALLCLLPALALGVAAWDLVGIGWGHLAVVTCVTIPAYLTAIRTSTGVSPAVPLRAIVRPLAAATVAAATAHLASGLVSESLFSLALGGTLGVLVYTVLAAPLLMGEIPGLSRVPLLRGVAARVTATGVWATAPFRASRRAAS